MAGSVAAEDGEGAAREGEFAGQKGAQRFGGAAFDGRGVDFDFQRVTEPADDLVARGVRDGFDCEGAGG